MVASCRTHTSPPGHHPRRAARPDIPASPGGLGRSHGPGQIEHRNWCTSTTPRRVAARRGRRPSRRTGTGGRRTPWRRSLRSSTTRVRSPSGAAPELPGGESGALGHGGELQPRHARMGVVEPRRGGGKSTIGAGDHVLAPDDSRVPDDPLGDQRGVLDQVGRVADDAGNEDFAVGRPELLEDVVLVLVPRVGRLEGIGARVDLVDDVDDVLQFHIVDPRADVDAVAGVEANLLGWNVAQRVVDRLYAPSGPLPAVRDAEVGVHHVLGDEARVVDPQHEARVDDGPVLFAKRVGEGLLVLFFGSVVLVLEGGEDVRGRDGRHKHFFVGQALQRGLDALDVSLNRRVSLVADGPDADVDAELAAATTAARPLRDALGPRVVVGERSIVPAPVPRVAFLSRRRRLAGETVEALDDVAEETRLALLPVGDDVDARLDLLANDVRHGVADQLCVSLPVVRLAAFHRSKDRDEGLRPRQAADVSAQDPLRTALHRSLLRKYRTSTRAGSASGSPRLWRG